MTSITLYECASDLIAALDSIDPETGEVNEQYESARALVASKAMAVASYIAQRELEDDAVEERCKEILARISADRKRIKWCRTYLAENMRATGILSIESQDKLLRVKLLIDRDESVNVFDQAQLPQEYIRTKIITEPNKLALRDAMREGLEIPGARLEKRDRLVLS